MINKVIKLKLQYIKHVYAQATCQRDQEVYATCHGPTNTKFGIPTSNYIQICSRLDLARTEPEVKVTVTWSQFVTRQGPRYIYIPNMELIP